MLVPSSSPSNRPTIADSSASSRHQAPSLAARPPDPPGLPPGFQLPDLDLLAGQQLPGELANVGQAAITGFGARQLAGGAGPRRHDLHKGQVEGAPAQPRQPLEVGLPADVDPLVAVPMWRQSPLVQPPLELVDVGLAAPGDRVSQPSQPRIGQMLPGQRHDRSRLAQVGDRVLQEPHVGLIGGHGCMGPRGCAAGREQYHHDPPSEAVKHHPLHCRAHARSR
jgi:hypothetical protein